MLRKLETKSEYLIKLQEQAIRHTLYYQMRRVTK